MTHSFFSMKAKPRKVANEASVYDRYHDAVNMTYSELFRWSKTPCSYKASLDRSPIERNLILLHKKRSEWDIFDEKAAKRTISFVARMRGVYPGKKIVCKEYGFSKRDVSLLNWAYDPRKEF
jgi:hypothetical protein